MIFCRNIVLREQIFLLLFLNACMNNNNNNQYRDDDNRPSPEVAVYSLLPQLLLLFRKMVLFWSLRELLANLFKDAGKSKQFTMGFK